MEALILAFLAVSSGSGSGSGSSSGFDDGSGYGVGSGPGAGSDSGSGSSPGYGYGYSNGSGSGAGSSPGYGLGSISGIKSYDSKPVHNVDGVRTLIHNVHGNIAKGHILQADLTLKPCFIAKVDDYFAHGQTAADALQHAEIKAFEDMDEDDRLDAFRAHFGAESRPGHEYFEWHQKLTGSCEMGRKQFVADHQIDLDKSYTVAEFVQIVRGAYGWDTVSKLQETT
jgi:hypothetical protein